MSCLGMLLTIFFVVGGLATGGVLLAVGLALWVIMKVCSWDCVGPRPK